jgi:hypothetical protein
MGKGDWVRPRRVSREEYGKNFERIFGVKKLNNEEDADGIQGDAGDGTSSSGRGERVHDVSEDPGGQMDSQAAGPVEPPPCGNCAGRGYTSSGDDCNCDEQWR